jgi:thioesterase DpgC
MLDPRTYQRLVRLSKEAVGASDSYFSLPAAQEGRVLGSLGSRKARQIVLYGRKIWAHAQDADLLFDEVVDTSELDGAVERSVRQLSNPA